MRPNHHQKGNLNFCPYAIINKYIEMRPGFHLNTEQFFVFADNSALYPRHMRNKLLLLLNAAGVNGTHFQHICSALDAVETY